MPPPAVHIEEGQAVTVQLFTAYGFAINLGVRRGDTLVAINGVTFHGDPKALRERFAGQARRKHAFTLNREGREFTVLTDSHRLGEWFPVPAPAERERTRLYPEVMTNYEVFATRAGKYDMYPLRLNPVALWAMPFYLMQMRLWMPLAAVFAGVILSIPVGLWMAAVVYLLCSVYVWKSGMLLIRGDRVANGMRHVITVAAANEEQAHRAVHEFDPDLSYLYELPEQFDMSSIQTEVS